MLRNCIECGKALKGRSDKKFCDYLCRIPFHNRRNALNLKEIRSINKILKRNRNILDQLQPDGKAQVSKLDLLKKGFDFDYFTHVNSGPAGQVAHYCYEYGYRLLDDKQVVLIRR